jgi:hypothetical protein
MASKRKQHFVPRLYLRQFSNEPGHKSIGVWHLQKGIFVRNASLKNQAYGVYFYGVDTKFEDALAQIEERFSQILKKITDTKQLPNHDSIERVTLIVYLVYQAERTQRAAEALNESIDKLVHIVFKEDERVKKDLPNLRVGIQNPAAFRLGVVSNILPVAMDLEMKLLWNKTVQEFVTSDNPVVKYNQFMESRKWPGGHDGWASVGLQVFFPISPSLCLVLYDKDIYRFGQRSHDLVEIEKIDDIDKLNTLQLLNANQNLYFSRGIREEYVKRLHRLYSHKRRTDKMLVKEYYELNADPKVKRSLITSHAYNIKIGLSLSFIHQTKKSKHRQLGPSMANPRNPSILKLVEEDWKSKM